MTETNAQFFVYIFGGQPRSSVEIGIAADLQQHLQQTTDTVSVSSATPRNLVYYEHYKVEEVAIARERQLKENTTDATYFLIESMNPNWLDLSDTLY